MSAEQGSSKVLTKDAPETLSSTLPSSGTIDTRTLSRSLFLRLAVLASQDRTARSAPTYGTR